MLKMALICSQNINKLEIQNKHLSVIFNFQKNPSDRYLKRELYSPVLLLRLVFCKTFSAKRVQIWHPSQPIFFVIISQNFIKSHMHVVKSCLVVFLQIKVIDGYKQELNGRHFIFKIKSFAPKATISFGSNLRTPTVMLSGQKAITQVVNCEVRVQQICNPFCNG